MKPASTQMMNNPYDSHLSCSIFLNLSSFSIYNDFFFFFRAIVFFQSVFVKCLLGCFPGGRAGSVSVAEALLSHRWGAQVTDPPTWPSE